MIASDLGLSGADGEILGVDLVQAAVAWAADAHIESQRSAPAGDRAQTCGQLLATPLELQTMPDRHPADSA